MNNVYKKADEIALLVGDLFSSTLEDLGAFKVNCADENSAVITALVSEYDDRGLVRISEIPQVIVHMDKLRLSQVIGNILFNSYKYAGTPIDISFRLDEPFLEVSIRDSGPGVSRRRNRAYHPQILPWKGTGRQGRQRFRPVYRKDTHG